MEQSQNTTSMVDMFMHPVFRVKDSIIVEANYAALQRQITVSTVINDLLITGQDEYASFTGGYLSVSIMVGGVTYIAGIVRYGDSDLFHLQSEGVTPELRTLALAAQNINQPLSNLLSMTDQFFSQEAIRNDPAIKQQAAHINRNLYQLMRIVKNMEFAGGNSQAKNFVTVNFVGLVGEILNKAASIAASGQKQLHIKLPSDSIYCLADEALIKRALYNMISNALKFSPAESDITAELSHSKDILRISICNHIDCNARDLMSSVYFRYLRDPGVEDGRNGLGLGISIIQSVAAAHGGTVLLDQPDADTVRFTMTIAIKNKPGMLHSNILFFDYAGGYDHALLELSDVLSPSEYSDIN